MNTGQHREMIDPMLGVFGITPDVKLDVMRPGQSLAEPIALLLQGLDSLLAARSPALVLPQVDTTTMPASAMASFYRHIPFGHVEAGLRTHDLGHPFPEEFKRIVAGRLAAIHFAPTAGAREKISYVKGDHVRQRGGNCFRF